MPPRSSWSGIPARKARPRSPTCSQASAEPAGRLPITFPRAIEDTPVHGAFYPGAGGVVRYGEGVFVGYRHYDAKAVEPLFPFGHGLSYTTFEIGKPALTSDAAGVHVSLPVTNTGARRGSEVVQLYVGAVAPSVPARPKELKAFAKVALDPGESKTIVLELDDRAFAFWDDADTRLARRTGCLRPACRHVVARHPARRAPRARLLAGCSRTVGRAFLTAARSAERRSFALNRRVCVGHVRAVLPRRCHSTSRSHGSRCSGAYRS